MKSPSFASRAWIAFAIVACGVGAAAWSWHAAEAQPAADAPSAKIELLPIPAGDPADLEAFIKKIDSTEPAGDTEEVKTENLKRTLATIAEASNRILKAKPDEEQSTRAQRYHLMAIQALGRLGDAAAAKEFAASLDATMADPRPEIAQVGWQSYLVAKLTTWDTLDEKAKDAVLAKVVERISRPHISPFEVSIVTLLAQNLDMLDAPFDAKLLEATLPILQKSDSDEVKTEIADLNLEGMLRRVKLPGQPMEVFGELLGGGKLDWKSYRGKVVLIDFSASWCPPCMAELPNVQAMYAKYKDKGFDVITVSGDRTLEAAEQLAKEKGIKWATLFSSKEDERYFSNPLTRYYGITGFPTAILLDKEGKVVNMEARDDVLRNELERLLGNNAEAASAPAPRKTAG